MANELTDLREQKGRVWSGVWNDGTVGWFAGPHLHGQGRAATRPEKYTLGNMKEGDMLVLCEYVLRPVLDKNGRPIIRRAKP
jgi:hypothetical protein